MLVALQDFMLHDENTAQGVGVHAEAARESALQPARTQRHVEMWPNSGGQLAALTGDAPALPGHNMIVFRRSVNHSPHVKRRRAPARSTPHAASAPAAPGAGPRRKKGRRIDVPKAGGSIFVHRPLGAQTADANTTIIVEDFPSMLRHPFDASITPVVYTLKRAREPQAPSIGARCQTFSAPAIDSTAVTSVRSPVQDPLQSTVAEAQYRSPPVSLKEMEYQPMNLDQLSFDQTATMNSAYGIHAHEALQEPMDIAFAPVMNADFGCQVELNYNPSSSTITAHDPYAQAERVLVGENRGPALGSNSEGQMINMSSSSASSDHSFQDMDMGGLINGSIDPPAAPQAELNDAGIIKNPRLTWTPELINRFEAAIVLLGGPSQATPKAIARCMACPQVNILNVKSRLQKFRLQAGMEAGTSRRTKRSHASRVTHDIKLPEDIAIGVEFMMKLVHKTCKNWSEQFDAQNLHMRHMLEENQTQSEAVMHNARVLEEYAERVSAQLKTRNLDEIKATES